MLIVDEYVAVRVVLGDWPDAMPDDEVALPLMGHWRLLQALHHPRGGQLTRVLSSLSSADQAALSWPHPEVLQVIDLRPRLEDAARLAARFGGGLRNAEILTIGAAHGAELWFGTPTNVGRSVTAGAAALGLPIHIAPL